VTEYRSSELTCQKESFKSTALLRLLACTDETLRMADYKKGYLTYLPEMSFFTNNCVKLTREDVLRYLNKTESAGLTFISASASV